MCALKHLSIIEMKVCHVSECSSQIFQTADLTDLKLWLRGTVCDCSAEFGVVWARNGKYIVGVQYTVDDVWKGNTKDNFFFKGVLQRSRKLCQGIMLKFILFR